MTDENKYYVMSNLERCGTEELKKLALYLCDLLREKKIKEINNVSPSKKRYDFLLKILNKVLKNSGYDQIEKVS